MKTWKHEWIVTTENINEWKITNKSMNERIKNN